VLHCFFNALLDITSDARLRWAAAAAHYEEIMAAVCSSDSVSTAQQVRLEGWLLQPIRGFNVSFIITACERLNISLHLLLLPSCYLWCCAAYAGWLVLCGSSRQHLCCSSS
jgi:hypothetical protein